MRILINVIENLARPDSGNQMMAGVLPPSFPKQSGNDKGMIKTSSSTKVTVVSEDWSVNGMDSTQMGGQGPVCN